MFTGLIEEVGTLVSFQHQHNDAKLAIACTSLQKDLTIGDSVACNGVCLTIVDFTNTQINVDLSLETKELSLFANMAKGSAINLERALTLQKRLGGHILQGHVDGLSSLIAIKAISTSYVLTFDLASHLRQYVVYKGSIAIDGISLTICDLTEDTFSVSVIPHTYANTNLNTLLQGNKVHLETDILGKYVENMLTFRTKKESSSITTSFLQENGFLL